MSFLPLIQVKNKSDSVISLMTKLLFGVLLCAAVLLAEKLMIQVIATKFHEQSYADRIANQKFAVKVLVTLYRNSNDIPGRSDTLTAAHAHKSANSHDPRRFIRQALKGVKLAATTTTTAFGNVASEIAGQSVLQPNSPSAMVKTALESANKSRLVGILLGLLGAVLMSVVDSLRAGCFIHLPRPRIRTSTSRILDRCFPPPRLRTQVG